MALFAYFDRKCYLCSSKINEMKKRTYIARLLLLFSILMLAIPVLPHHHHADGKICMKDDVHTMCCTQHANDMAHHDHGCEESGCPTSHFFQQMPQGTQRTIAADELTNIELAEAIYLCCLHATQKISKTLFTPYQEALYSTMIGLTMGLRAPPCA